MGISETPGIVSKNASSKLFVAKDDNVIIVDK
jgi:hypothetical protein